MGATRRGPRHLTKKQLLAEFGYCCAYCDYPQRWATEYASYLCGRYEKSDSTDPAAHRYRPSAYLTPMPETYPTYPEPLIAPETDDENLESPDKDESSESLYGATVDVLEGTESL